MQARGFSGREKGKNAEEWGLARSQGADRLHRMKESWVCQEHLCSLQGVEEERQDTPLLLVCYVSRADRKNWNWRLGRE